LLGLSIRDPQDEIVGGNGGPSSVRSHIFLLAVPFARPKRNLGHIPPKTAIAGVLASDICA
jgi:hypothetical protein